MHSLLTLENLPRPIQDGDAGVVLTPDGKFFVFSTGAVDENNMTPRQIEQGRQLQAISVALQIPAIMNVLYDLANDPKIVGDQLVDYGQAH